MSVLLIVLIVCGAIVLFFGLFGLIFRLQKKRAGEVLARFKGRKVFGVTSGANFFGRQSAGMAQVRGNGVLVLAEGELYFEMLAPKKSLSIPFTALRSVETVRSFLGKTRGRSLLKVDFENDQGEPDAAAWLIGKHKHWKDALQKVIEMEGKNRGGN